MVIPMNENMLRQRKVRFRTILWYMVSLITLKASNVGKFKIFFYCNCLFYHLEIFKILIVVFYQLQKSFSYDLIYSAKLACFCSGSPCVSCYKWYFTKILLFIYFLNLSFLIFALIQYLNRAFYQIIYGIIIIIIFSKNSFSRRK